MNREEAEKLTILRCEVGSTAHGVSLGNDDRDEMGILIEPMDRACGMGHPFEQFIYRDAAVREGRHDAPSQSGDLDLTLYSLRKWLGLALKGNPTILSMLYAPIISCDSRGTQLRELAPLIISKQVGKQYLGYMQAQRQKMLGERGIRVHRPDLVAEHGFDTKFAYHMLRLGLQGVELLETGKFSMPVQPRDRDFLLQVRRGEVPKDDCVQLAIAYEGKIKHSMEHGILREEPDRRAAEEWMLKIYFRNWSATRKLEDILEDYTLFYRAKYEHGIE